MKANIIYTPIFQLGYLLFKITKKTYWYPYVSFRRLFVITKGESNDRMNAKLETVQTPYALPNPQGVLGTLSQAEVKSIADKISENGFYIFDTRLDADKVQELTNFALQAKAELIPAAADGTKFTQYDRNNLLSPRYQFSEQEVMNHPTIQKLATDASLFAVAQAYLGCKPIQDLTAMWWSTIFSKKASSEAAQLYHFDMDRFKFIKFFFYLTDVDAYNGPHCYVKGSHRNLPENLWKDGRIEDREIVESFPKESILEITGPKGTIIAVDTRGLHKGKVLEKGERLILQFEFTNSLFGAPYERIDLRGKLLPEVNSFFQKFAYSFQRFKF